LQMWARPDFRVVIFCNVALGLAYSFVIPFTSIFGTQEAGMSSKAFAAYMLITSICSLLASTALSRWSDLRIPRKTILWVSGLFGVAGYACNAYFRNFWALLAVGVVFMAISSISFSQLFAHARDCLDRSGLSPAETPFYMNVFRLCFAFSWTVGPALASWILYHGSFVHLYLTAAGLFGVYVLLVAAYIRKEPPSEVTRAAAQSMAWHAIYRAPGVLPHFLAFILVFCSTTLGMMSLPLLILNTLHGNETQVGIAYSLAPIFEVPLMFWIGALATRVETARIIRISLLVGVIYFGGLFLVRSPVQVYCLQFLSATIVAVTSGIAITFFQDLLKNQPGSATNIYANAQRIGSMAGYILFGALQAVWPLRSVFAAATGFCLVAWGIVHWKRQKVSGNLVTTTH
jgi:MFS transporter, SET family, sugar efflux transporter